METEKKDYTRVCPSCGKTLHYTSKYAMERYLKTNTICRGCSKRKRSPFADRIIELNSQGVSNAEIARILGCCRDTPYAWLRREGLKTSLHRRSKEEMESDILKCSRCKQEKDKSYFDNAYGISKAMCRVCEKERRYELISANIPRFCHNRYIKIRASCKSEDIYFNLSEGYILYLYERQEGKCFYTSVHLDTQLGLGKRENNLSVDRVIPSLGYIDSNVVLCSFLANMCKQNINLEQMKEWMPFWFNRLLEEEKTGRINLHLQEETE